MSDLRCRFCKFTTRKFRTTKSGKVVSGFVDIRNHIEQAHPEKAEELFKEPWEDDE